MNELVAAPKGMPEIIPRVTPAETKSNKEKSCLAPNLHALINVLNALGAFGGQQLHMWQIAHLMHETHRADGRSLSVPSNGKRSDYDRTAEDHLNRLLSVKARLLKKEVEFFKECLGRIFHPENVARLSIEDEEMFSMHPTILIHKLLADIPPVSLGSIDPLMALVALALAEDDPIEINLKQHGQQNNRSIVSRRYPPTKYDYELGEVDVRTLAGGYQFRIFVPKDASNIKPLAVSFTFSPGKHVAKDGTHAIDTRGRVLTNVQPTDDETSAIIREDAGPWRIAEDGNQPFEINKAAGRSGFLVLSDVGDRWDRFFPDECDEHALCDDDYRHLYSEIANLAATGNAPKLGVLLYEVE